MNFDFIVNGDITVLGGCGCGWVVVKELTLHLPQSEINSRTANRRRGRAAVPAGAGRTAGLALPAGGAAALLGEGGGQPGGQTGRIPFS